MSEEQSSQTEATQDSERSHQTLSLSRRSALAGALGFTAGAGASAVAATQGLFPKLNDGGSESAVSEQEPLQAAGPAKYSDPMQRPGISWPSTPQLFSEYQVLSLPQQTPFTEAAQVKNFLAPVGQAITKLTEKDPSTELPEGPGDLSVVIGIGPRLLRLGEGSPGAEELPRFKGDEALAQNATGGDLLLMVCSSDPSVLVPAAEAVRKALPEHSMQWSQLGFRPRGKDGATRNPFGFTDGIIIPRSDEELQKNVWISDGEQAGGTICVVRMFRLDLEGFARLNVPAREKTVGREFISGKPLSGGGPTDQVDLGSKDSDGEYKVPTLSHARRAHPSFTDSALMLRRGYSYNNGQEQGLIFTCFQRDLRSFVETQRRIDEGDAMMEYAQPRASFTFLIPPVSWMGW